LLLLKKEPSKPKLRGSSLREEKGRYSCLERERSYAQPKKKPPEREQEREKTGGTQKREGVPHTPHIFFIYKQRITHPYRKI